MPKITDSVFGVRGVGGYFGSVLARAGHPVISIARGVHFEAICSDGFQLAIKLQF
jgi:2-dehydropantoate 2-reductase